MENTTERHHEARKMNMHDFRVDTTIDAGIEAVMRFQSIRRWHMIDTTRQQSIGEHSANVALLAFYIASTVPDGYFGPPTSILAPALLHDLPEVFIGDIPTHTKKYLMGVDELEERLTPSVFNVVATDDKALLIKLCDLADGIRFIEKFGVDRVAIFAMKGLEAQLQAKFIQARAKWPSEVYEVMQAAISTYIYQ